MIAGNHDSSIESNYFTKSDFQSRGIIYLEDDFVVVEGIKIYGSPVTPTFGNWLFMKSRNKLHEHWQHIPDDIDIMVVHGPPRSILDLSYNQDNKLEFCGCTALAKRMYQIKPKYCMFGHIHNFKDLNNAGFVQFPSHKTIYSNGTCVEDGRFDKGIVNHGNLFKYVIEDENT